MTFRKLEIKNDIRVFLKANESYTKDQASGSDSVSSKVTVRVRTVAGAESGSQRALSSPDRAPAQLPSHPGGAAAAAAGPSHHHRTMSSEAETQQPPGYRPLGHY